MEESNFLFVQKATPAHETDRIGSVPQSNQLLNYMH